MNKFTTLLTLLALSAAAPAAAAKHEITWLLGHKNLDYFEEAAETFKRTVETGSKGAIAVKIVTLDEDTGAHPAKNPEIAAKVARGEAQLGHSFADVLGAVEPKMRVFEAPYLFRGYRHMEGVIEGPVGTALLAGLREKGLAGLSFTYSGGASGVATKDRPLRRPEDLKGLKVAVYGDEVEAAWLKRLGATPVAVEHRLEAILPLAREGKVDAAVITWRNFEQSSLHEDFRHFGLPGSTYLVSVTYANAKFFDSLPQDLRELVLNASREAARVERAKTIELNEKSKRLMLAKGVTPAHLSASGRKAFAAALKPADAEIARLLGPDFVESVRRAPDGAVHPAITPDFAGR